MPDKKDNSLHRPVPTTVGDVAIMLGMFIYGALCVGSFMWAWVISQA